MSRWTKEEWPYFGSSEVEKLDLGALKLNLRSGNPKWDYAYMSECVSTWASCAQEEGDLARNEKQCEWMTDEWKKVICECAGVVWMSQFPVLTEKLGLKNVSVLEKRVSNDAVACAKVLIG